MRDNNTRVSRPRPSTPDRSTSLPPLFCSQFSSRSTDDDLLKLEIKTVARPEREHSFVYSNVNPKASSIHNKDIQGFVTLLLFINKRLIHLSLILILSLFKIRLCNA